MVVVFLHQAILANQYVSLSLVRTFDADPCGNHLFAQFLADLTVAILGLVLGDYACMFGDLLRLYNLL